MGCVACTAGFAFIPRALVLVGVGGGEVIGELNELNEEQGLLLEVIVPPLDEEEERDVFGNSTGAKGRATDSPATAPFEDTVIGEDTTTVITIDSITIDLDEPEIAAPGFPTLPPVEVVVEEEEEDPMIPVDTADTANKGDTTVRDMKEIVFCLLCL